MMKVDLLKGNIIKSLLFFSIPIFISNLFQELYNTVDIMIVGNYLGNTSLAAIGASSALYGLLVGFSLGVGNGLSIAISRSYGSNDKELLKKSIASSIVIGIVISLLVTIISEITLLPLLRLLKTPENIILESYSYISVIVLFIIIMFSYNLCAGILRATGNSIAPLIFLIISSLLHIILDFIFIIYLKFGVKGTAISTVISEGVSVVLCLIYIKHKCSHLIPSKKHFVYDRELYKEMFSQGISMGFMVSIVSIGSVILQTAINKLGYLVIAGHSAARKLNSFCWMPISTLSLALSIFVSQNKGADQGNRILNAIKKANILGIFWSFFISLFIFFYAKPLMKLISGSNESIIINNGSKYLMITTPFYSILSILLNLRLSLQSLGEKIIPLFSSIIELIGKIIFVIFIIPYLKYTGVIFCEPIIWCFMVIQLFIAFKRNYYLNSLKTTISC